MGHVFWFTGLSGAGKSTIANYVINELGLKAQLLDGDISRHFLTKDLGFTVEDRKKNIERNAFVAGLLAKNDIPVLATFITPTDEIRQVAKNIIEDMGNKFHLIYIDTSLAECINRDVKGLYEKAIKGEIPNFTGLTSPFDIPKMKHINVKTNEEIKTTAEKVYFYINSLMEEGGEN